jgi:hypothetical protein
MKRWRGCGGRSGGARRPRLVLVLLAVLGLLLLLMGLLLLPPGQLTQELQMRLVLLGLEGHLCPPTPRRLDLLLLMPLTLRRLQ